MIEKINCFLSKTNKFFQEARIKRRGIQQVKQLIEIGEKIRLDIGCGSITKPGFIGLDISPAADLQWNLQWGLPFDDNSVAEIRSDHCLEHLELPLVVEVLRECKRVLVPGGILDFTVPHIDIYLDAYIRKDFEFFKGKITDIPLRHEHLYATCFDRLSWLLHRAGEHKSLFDKESIIAKVKLAGFQKVMTREFEQEKDINFRFSSIYVVAVK